MPIHLGKDFNGPFVQWGHRTKYYYTPGNKNSLNRAKAKAKKQMGAIFANRYIGQQIENNDNVYIQKIYKFTDQVKNIFLKGLNTCAKASDYDLWTMNDFNNKLKSSPEMNWFFIKNNQQIIGTFSYCITEGIFNFKDFSIFQEYQGLGFGDKAFKVILQYWKSVYPNTVFQFGVAGNNIKAINLYMKNNAKIIDRFKIKDVDFYSMRVQNNILKESKFNKIYSNILIQTYNPKSTKIEICQQNLSDIVCNYYQQYYKNNPNNRQKFRIGWDQNDNPVESVPDIPEEMLCQDIKNFIFCKNDFERFHQVNNRYIYFVCLDQGYLIGILKYWYNGGMIEKLPTIGYIDINKNFRHQQYGIALMDKCFQYHAENYPDVPLLLTEYSDEGALYMKHVCERLAEKYNVDIFMFDDIRKLEWQIKYKDYLDYKCTYQPSEKILNYIKNKK